MFWYFSLLYAFHVIISPWGDMFSLDFDLWSKPTYTIKSYAGYVLAYKLRYIVGFGLCEMAISTNPNPTIYRKA